MPTRFWWIEAAACPGVHEGVYAYVAFGFTQPFGGAAALIYVLASRCVSSCVARGRRPLPGWVPPGGSPAKRSWAMSVMATSRPAG